MKDTVLITGANSFIAKHIIPLLADDYNLKMLSRNPVAENEYYWNLEKNEIDERSLDDVNYIIHLAGSKLNDGTPLTAERAKLVRDSRIGATEFLLEKLKIRGQKLKALISASALGFYGFTDNKLEIDEDGEMGSGFAAQLSNDWEKAADLFTVSGIADRVVKLRVCLVLGNEGGIFKDFKTMLTTQPQLLKNSVGNTYFPWVHVDDMAGMFAYGVTNSKLEGVFNTTAPIATTKEVIFKQMYALSTKNTELFNQTDTSYNGQFLSSAKIVNEGFKFKYPSINEALKNLI
jgi:uncharacterized protein (TIGR01777 family)